MIPDTPAALLAAIDADGTALPSCVVMAFSGRGWRAAYTLAEAYETEATIRARRRWAGRIPPAHLLRHIVRLGTWTTTLRDVMEAEGADVPTAVRWLRAEAVYWVLANEAAAAGLSSPWVPVEEHEA